MMQQEPYELPLSDIQNLLELWKLVEVLSVSKSEKLSEYYNKKDLLNRDKKLPYLVVDKEELFLFEHMPHLDPIFAQANPEPGKTAVVFWHLYFGHLNWTKCEIAIEQKLETLFKGKAFNFSTENKNPLKNEVVPAGGLILCSDGTLHPDSLMLTGAVWAFGRILAAKSSEDLKNIVNCQGELLSVYSLLLKDYTDKYGIDAYFKKEEMDFLERTIHEFLGIPPEYFISKPPVFIKKIVYQYIRESSAHNATPPPLEIFDNCFLEDIQYVQDNLENIHPGSALGQYLGMSQKPNSIDILKSREHLNALLEVSKMQHSRWPSSPQQHLAALQAAALNFICKNSFQNEEKLPDYQLFAINGPPGTGKTTLMFDLIVNVYVNRARKLAQLDHPEKGFLPETHKINVFNYNYNVKHLDPSLLGGEILVSSSNNKAVENLSVELPLLDNIAPCYRDKINLFSWVNNSHLEDKNMWGWFSAALGNSENRQKFLKSFWDFSSSSANNDESTSKKIFSSFKEYLSYLKHSKRLDNHTVTPVWAQTSARAKVVWSEACTEFNNKYEKINNIHKTITQYNDLLKKRSNLLKKDEEAKNKDILIKKMNDTLHQNVYESETLWEEVNSLKLGLLDKLFNYRLHKLHQKRLEILIPRISTIDNKIKDLQRKITEHNKNIPDNNSCENLQSVDKIIPEIEEQLSKWGFSPLDVSDEAYWIKSEADFHQCLPFQNEKMEKLRSELFIDALKIHELFVIANGRLFEESMRLFANLIGKPKPKEASNELISYNLRQVWYQFFMIIPVVSTTFSSVSKMLKYFNAESIGWLLIDEAGQANPQHALGAIYRSKNIIVIGDPLQTTPISTPKEEIINHLFIEYKLSPNLWAPAKVSVQNLADRNNIYQTTYGLDNHVGFPLLVHRRCDYPMFEICNQLSYNNKMIYAVKKRTSPIGTILGKSRWIDVIDSYAKLGEHYSKTEYDKLIEMIENILNQGDTKLLEQIYIITFFRKYAQQIKINLEDHFKDKLNKILLTDFCRNNIGTVHAFQGKENDSVIFLLGSPHPLDEGAKLKMSEKPNVLNVAVSRAKNNFYVIGNKNLWGKFDHVLTLYNCLNFFRNSNLQNNSEIIH